jgi:hypothetical protein
MKAIGRGGEGWDKEERSITRDISEFCRSLQATFHAVGGIWPEAICNSSDTFQTMAITRRR